MQLFFLIVVFSVKFYAKAFDDKYDLKNLPFDLRPVRGMVGRWQLVKLDGTAKYSVKPPDIFDFGINPIPMFGSRALNITGHYLGSDGSDVETIYGFMPVRNATRRDPRVHAAFITTYSGGINVMEQGFVHDRQKVRFRLKQFMTRSFGQNINDGFLQLDELEREILIKPNILEMGVKASSNFGKDDYLATYWRIVK